jgi:hypothetical protein
MATTLTLSRVLFFNFSHKENSMKTRSIKMKVQRSLPVRAKSDKKRGLVILTLRLADRMVRLELEPWIAGAIAKQVLYAIPCAQRARCMRDQRFSCGHKKYSELPPHMQRTVEGAVKIAEWGLKPTYCGSLHHRPDAPFTIDEALAAFEAFVDKNNILVPDKISFSFTGENRFTFRTGPGREHEYELTFERRDPNSYGGQNGLRSKARITQTTMSRLAEVEVKRDLFSKEWDVVVTSPTSNGESASV